MLLIKKRVLSNSPFRYPGGKFYARKIILNKIPNHSKYCEPFVGGGSIFFAKEKCTQNILNDKDKELTNCYKVIQNNLDQLIKKLKNIKATRDLHSYYKNEYVPQNNIERAFKYYYLNRTSYSGIMKPQNCYWGYGDKYSMRPENWANHLINVSAKLQKVKILNLDFEDLFNKLDDNYFLFIDPPYFNADQDKFYNEIFTKEDHLRLVKVLKKNRNKFKFLLTYDNCEEIRELYSWTKNITEETWNYTISRTDDQKNEKRLSDGYKSKRKKGKELFISNYKTNQKQLDFLFN